MALLIKKPTMTKPTVSQKVEEKQVQAPIAPVVQQLEAKLMETITVKIKRNSDYSTVGIELFHSKQVEEGADTDALYDAMILNLTEKVNAYMEEHTPAVPVNSTPDFQQEIGEESAESAEGGELTEESIRAMDRDTLVNLVKEYDLGIDVKKFRKAATLADAIIAQLTQGDDTATDESGDDSGTDDSGAEEGTELTEESIRAMERADLVGLIKEYDLGINPKEYKKTSELADAIIETITAGSEEGEEPNFDNTDFDNE